MSDRINLIAPASPIEFCFMYPIAGRYGTNWDRKSWPGPEIQMYYGCPWLSMSHVPQSKSGILRAGTTCTAPESLVHFNCTGPCYKQAVPYTYRQYKANGTVRQMNNPLLGKFMWLYINSYCPVWTTKYYMQRLGNKFSLARSQCWISLNYRN